MASLEERIVRMERTGVKVDRDRSRAFPILDGKLTCFEIYWNDPMAMGTLECQVNQFQCRYVRIPDWEITQDERDRLIKHLEADCEKVLLALAPSA